MKINTMVENNGLELIKDVFCPHCLEEQEIERGVTTCPSCGETIPDGVIDMAERIIYLEDELETCKKQKKVKAQPEDAANKLQIEYTAKGILEIKKPEEWDKTGIEVRKYFFNQCLCDADPQTLMQGIKITSSRDVNLFVK